MKNIFLFLILLPFSLVGQETDSTKIRKIEIGITYSPDYCYRSLKPDAINKWITDIRDTLEIPKLGYTTGLNATFYINKKITLETGILFSDKGEKTKKYVINGSTSSIQTDNNQATKNKFIYHYLYFDIPAKVNYYILTKKLKLFLSAGVSTNIFLLQKTTSVLEYNDGHSEKNNSVIHSGFSRINLAVIGGFGINYNLTNRFNFRLEPVYRRSLTSIIKAPVKDYLYSAGLNVGIFYKL